MGVTSQLVMLKAEKHLGVAREILRYAQDDTDVVQDDRGSNWG